MVIQARSQSGARVERGAHILEAARELFAEKGAEAVSMADVAEAAGVSRATVFNHFGSKRALVEAITQGVFDYYAGMLDRALADERSSAPTLVRALFDQMGLGIQALHGFYRSVFREIMKLQVGLEEGGAVAQASDRAHARLERLLARGQARGELSREYAASDLAHAFTSLSNGTINHWLYGDTSESLRTRMGRSAEIFLGSVAIADRARGSEPLPDLLSGAPPIPAPRIVALSRARARRNR
jgi:AcrR family transcriptional regulator